MFEGLEDETNKSVSNTKNSDSDSSAVVTACLQRLTASSNLLSSKRSRTSIPISTGSCDTAQSSPGITARHPVFSLSNINGPKYSVKNRRILPVQDANLRTGAPNQNHSDVIQSAAGMQKVPCTSTSLVPSSPVLSQKSGSATHALTTSANAEMATADSVLEFGTTMAKEMTIPVSNNSPKIHQSTILTIVDGLFLKSDHSSLQSALNTSTTQTVESGDVTSVHSYSLASASSLSISSSTAQKGDSINVKVSPMPSSVPAISVRTAPKRPSSVLTEVPMDELFKMQLVAYINKKCNELLYGIQYPLNLKVDGLIQTLFHIPCTFPSRPKKIRIDKSSSVEIFHEDVPPSLRTKITCLRKYYYVVMAESFFLKHGGNLMDMGSWRKKPPVQFIEFLRSQIWPEASNVEEEIKDAIQVIADWNGCRPSANKLNAGVRDFSSGKSSSSHSLPSIARILSTTSSPVPKLDSANSVSTNQTNVSKSSKQSILGTKSNPKHSLSAVYDSSIGSQQEIVERAKQEAYVMQRIGDLRKEGLWSLKRMPKVQETARSKAHWDYLLEEMVWLSTDFAQERKWKKAAAKKCARMITKYFQEKEMKVEKAEKEQLVRLRRIAGFVAKEVKLFWANIEKVVEFKQQTWIDKRKKKALDSHLNFIVDQTEKYSSWLTEGLNRNLIESAETSRASSPVANVEKLRKPVESDDDYLPVMSESDNEDTIDKEENENDYDEEEVKLLQEESELPLEDILEQLPKEILENPAELSGGDVSSDDNSISNGKLEEDEDEEFQLPSSEAEDDEETIVEQEEEEKDSDYSSELKDLQNESELPIEQLMEKYRDAYCSELETSMNDEGIGHSDYTSSQELSFTEKNKEPDDKLPLPSCDSGPSQDITDIAATAERFQPKGNTLSTTQVCTKVPFLLKHQLREYQHIGLDWLNAMYEKKLNGILADEMGLGKTIQTISLLAHLACEKGVWGPHLIVVPTSVMLNWEMEFKKWCPAFKILTYYGTPKERKQKRIGWTKPNAFHVCITSYKLVVQDHHSFRRKRWVYLILDEAQHIKNFKSQRWQMLLNFQSTHRLLLTGTPLQNDLMELWSLMHFLMPSVFQSHRDFREWFVNPVTGMIEGNHEYNESLIKRLHKVLRPFLLRRLKSEVEKQLPKKYEHVVMCRLSKRQRYLYDDFMSQTKTQETLASGNFMSVINILMQLRKVCNHPNMFEPRPIVSPFMMSSLVYHTASAVWGALDHNPFKNVCLWTMNLLLVDIEMCVSAFAAHRTKKFQTTPSLIEMVDSLPENPPPPPAGKIKLTITGTRGPPTHHSSQPRATVLPQARLPPTANRTISPFNAGIVNPQRYMMMSSQQPSVPPSRTVTPAQVSGSYQAGQQHSTEYTVQLLQQTPTSVPLGPLAPIGNQVVASAPFTVQIPAGTRMPLSIGRLVQTSTGPHLLITPSVSTVASDQSSTTSVSTTMSFTSLNPSTTASITSGANTPNIATATVLPQIQKIPPNPVIPPIIASFNRTPGMNSISSGLPSQINYNKPIGRVAPLNIHPPLTSTSACTSQTLSSFTRTTVHPISRSQTRARIEVPDTVRVKEKKISEFHIESLAVCQAKSRQEKLLLLGKTNLLRCAACPVYGPDLVEAVTVFDNIRHPQNVPCKRGQGFINCLNAPFMEQRPKDYWYYTRHLWDIIKTPEKYIEDLADIIKRFVFIVPPVSAPSIQLHVSHPSPSKLNNYRKTIEELNTKLSPACAMLHPIVCNTSTYFPELRLIEYDCGKLQRLAQLLWELKSGSHRVLIFTQMTRMLDILEQFLSYHGHTYLRLDGTTKIEMRQALMERFNADKKIFCFILSTRSGGIGVNLTGADTVIFYDSDWNPTMDAQAQDRCHRIGQTRDVHIYRLISERTIEENILKKANQKKLLGDLAIEGGNFTTAFFKKNTLHELFGLGNPDIETKPDSADYSMDDSVGSSTESAKNYSEVQLEQALGMAEEELDLQAAAIARDEAAAELAEFDESIPFDNDSRDVEDKSAAEEELDRVMGQLRPVERYAMRFFESLQEPVTLEQLKQAEEEIEAQKREWELGRLKALKEEEERLFRKERLLNHDDPLLCYGRDTVANQVAKSHSSPKLKKRDRSNESLELPQRRSPRINYKTDQKDSGIYDTNESVNGYTTSNNVYSKVVDGKKFKYRNHLKHNCIHSPPNNRIVNGPTKHRSLKNGKKMHVIIKKRNICNGDKNLKPTFNSVCKPFSNPNLVIRTRRASAIEAEKSCIEPESSISCTTNTYKNSLDMGALESLLSSVNHSEEFNKPCIVSSYAIV